MFLVDGVFCPLPKKGCFDESCEIDEFAFYPLKKGLLLKGSFSHLDSLTLDKLELDVLASWLKLLSLSPKRELATAA